MLPSITLLIFIAAAVIASTYSQQDVLHVFLLAGQSNMAGRGGVVATLDPTTNVTVSSWDGVVPPESTPDPYSRILRLSANLSWVLAREPLHADIDVNKTNGVGPGMVFANEVMRRDLEALGRIGLVPCAIGGTRIGEWERGGALYRQLVERAKAAMGVDGNGGGRRMEGMLWYQGESDTVEAVDAGRYKANVERFFEDLRVDLGMPSLPIFQVAIASAEGPYMNTIRKAQFDVNVTNVRTVDAEGLPLEPDGLHLTTPAQVQLGQILATAFLQSIPSTIPDNEHPLLLGIRVAVLSVVASSIIGKDASLGPISDDWDIIDVVEPPEERAEWREDRELDRCIEIVTLLCGDEVFRFVTLDLDYPSPYCSEKLVRMGKRCRERMIERMSSEPEFCDELVHEHKDQEVWNYCLLRM